MSNFEEVVEKYLRPKALTENFDHSTWSDERAVWILNEAVEGMASGEAAPVFSSASLVESGPQESQVKLANGKVKGSSRNVPV